MQDLADDFASVLRLVHESSNGSKRVVCGRLVNLQSVKAYNGRVCRTQAADHANERIAVTIAGKDRPFAVKPENIAPLPSRRGAGDKGMMHNALLSESHLRLLLRRLPTIGELPELVDSVISFLKIAQVDPASVVATRASSTGPMGPSHCSNTLKPDHDTWWISAPGSCPQGEGREWVEYCLSPTAPVRVDFLTLTIPPMPSGPLSVKVFHLELSNVPDGPWERATDDMHTVNSIAQQEWALCPPIEARFVRIVCTLNAAGSLARKLDSMPDCQLPDSIGFFCIGFS